MLKRNLGVKTAPQRWQDNAADGTFDVVLTFEEKVFDMALEGLYVDVDHPFFCMIVKLTDKLCDCVDKNSPGIGQLPVYRFLMLI